MHTGKASYVNVRFVAHVMEVTRKVRNCKCCISESITVSVLCLELNCSNLLNFIKLRS